MKQTFRAENGKVTTATLASFTRLDGRGIRWHVSEAYYSNPESEYVDISDSEKKALTAGMVQDKF